MHEHSQACPPTLAGWPRRPTVGDVAVFVVAVGGGGGGVVDVDISRRPQRGGLVSWIGTEKLCVYFAHSIPLVFQGPGHGVWLLARLGVTTAQSPLPTAQILAAQESTSETERP